MKTTIRCLVTALVLLAALVACTTITTEEPKYHSKPSFEQSHAILIDKTVAGLPIVAAIKNCVKKTEKLAVMSLERSYSGDSPVNYLIDDNFISALATEGYRVLERDDNLMGWIIPEQSSVYKGSLRRELPVPPALAMVDALTESGNPKDNNEAPSDAAGLYRQLRDDYAALEAQQVRMDSADVIVSYRLLECGIIYDIEKKKQGTIDAATGKENPNSQKLWTYNVKRDALARLFVRVTDAKTGEIRNADVLQNEMTDTVTFSQDKDESDYDFFARINEYLTLLSKYHYTYYDQQLPDQKGTGQQVVAVTDTSLTRTPSTLLGSAKTPATPINPNGFPGTTICASLSGGIAVSQESYIPYSSYSSGTTENGMFMLGAQFSTALFRPLGLLVGLDAGLSSDDIFITGGLTLDLGNAFRMGLRGGASVTSSTIIFSVPFLINLKSFILSFDVGLTTNDTSTGVFVGAGGGFGF